MYKDIIRVLALSCAIITLNPVFSQSASANHEQLIESLLTQAPSGFTNLEHKTLGDEVALQWAPFVPQQHIQLTNGLSLTYGDILMFGGDLFGDPDSPIARCETDSKKLCFMKQFNALAAPSELPESDCHHPITQVHTLQAYFKEVQQQLDDAIAQGIPAWAFYKKNNINIAKKLNRITCGGSFLSDFFPFGQYLLLAQVNFDHFAPDALDAYQTGHSAALETAIKAHDLLARDERTEALQTLHQAYAQNAFACHFISDAMSSGHMRVPRRALHFHKEAYIILNLLLANIMHEEDSTLGLTVMNHEGLKWKALGDAYLTHPDTRTQNAVLHQILQRSADHVYDAFVSGQMPDAHDEMRLLPDYDHISETENHAALFKVENNQLLKREKNHDPLDYHWTNTWNGLLTLLDFQVNQ